MDENDDSGVLVASVSIDNVAGIYFTTAVSDNRFEVFDNGATLELRLKAGEALSWELPLSGTLLLLFRVADLFLFV